MEGVALVAGIVFLGFGALLVFVALAAGRRRDPAAAHSTGVTTTVDQAGTGPVALRGSVVADEDRLLRDPLTDRQVVWYRLEVTAGRSGSGRTGVKKQFLHTESDRVDFLLDDGSGQPARVAVADITGYVTRHDQYGAGTVVSGGDGLPWAHHELTGDLAERLRERSGESSSRHLGANLYTVAPGDTVTVVGWLDRADTGPVVVGRPPQHRLLVYGVDHDELVQDREERHRNRVGLVMAGIVMVAVGGLAIWWGSGGT